jgi:predicted aspartyl protease
MVRINGKGPYRMIVDTGGSITLSLDSEVAADIGLEKLADGSVRGVSGKDEAWQALTDELRIGGITCKRVMTRVFGVRAATAFSADGILGTGVFADARMKLDFEHAELHVTPSSDAAAAGHEYALRIVGDAKLMAPVTIQGDSATALLDSGADVIALSPSRMKRLFPDVDPQSFRLATAGVGAGEMPKITLSKGVDLEFGGRTWENVSGLGLDVLDTILSSYLGVQCDVLIGMPSFRQMKSFTVDFPKRRMWIEWLETEAK